MRRLTLAVADEFPIERLRDLLAPLALDVFHADERELDVRWSREVAERAIELYADGWAAQVRSGDSAESAEARTEALARMREELERQLADRRVYVPFGPIRLAIARRATA